MERNEILARVRERSERWDLIVIGGGATGVGCAVDAASRGFDVLLVEGADFGKGTSSRSTKLVHGGVRYLAQGNISLVREALKERGILMRNAPHAVRKMGFTIPCYSVWQKLFYGAGLKIYDLLSGEKSFGKTRILSREETLKRLPNANPANLRGGVFYFDGQFDDARLLIDLVRTAHDGGAAVLNYARVSSLIKAGGRIAGVEFEDTLGGGKFAARAGVVINATGAFCDEIRKMSDGGARKIVSPSQGIHLVFDREFLPGEDALMIPKTSDGRVLFAIPWHGSVVVGTTDTAVESADLEPKALEKEIEFVLETVAKYLAKKPERKDIKSMFAGIRPLVKSSDVKNTASLSRGHTIEIDASGLLTITGGKWTTYRSMAEDAVNQALRVGGLEARPSKTEGLAIRGSHETPHSGNRLHPELPVSAAGVVRAVRHEMAQTLEDVLARRTRALFLNARAAMEIAPEVAGVMAEELGRSEEWVSREIAEFEKLAERYLPLQNEPPRR